MSDHKQERVGVYVCHCGSNIAGTDDVVDVANWAQEKLGPQGVVIAREYRFMCSSPGQELIEKDTDQTLGCETSHGLLYSHDEPH